MDGNFDDAFKKKLLEPFRFTIDFLEKHNIRWYAAGGTAIGAVRHRGMIPWDDDVDLFIHREDFNKLPEYRGELRKNGLGLLFPDDGIYTYRFAKICNEKTSVWETEGCPVLMGVYIDLFPYDYTTLTEEEYASNYTEYCWLLHRYTRSSLKYSFANFIHDLKGFHLRRIRSGIENTIYYNRLDTDKCKKEFNEFDAELTSSDGEHVVALTGLPIIEYYNRSDFDDFVEMPFEDFTVKMMSGWDNYLTRMYGDYMTPPSSFRRRTHHGKYYINLKERLTLEEIAERKKRGENFVY